MIPIFCDAIPVAHLDDRDGVVLSYDRDWANRRAAFPLSLTMPLGDGPYQSDRVLPWLANLLPEAGLGCQAGRSNNYVVSGVSGNHFRFRPCICRAKH